MKSLFILSTGTELSSGRSIDTNAPYLARYFTEAGYDITGSALLPDDKDSLIDLFQLLLQRNIDGIIMTGGLGPTADDHTIDSLSEFINLPAIEDPVALRKLQVIASRRPDLKLEAARRQVRILQGAKILENDTGLAPGVLVLMDREKNLISEDVFKQASEKSGPQSPCFFIAAMPGVPQEMKPMAAALLKELEILMPVTPRYRKVFYLYGIGESAFEHRFFSLGSGSTEKPLISPGNLSADFRWGITSAPGHIRVFMESKNSEEIDHLYSVAEAEYKECILEAPIENQLHEYCLEHNISVSTAESCTGGLIGKIISDIPGASAFYSGTIVSYANKIKETMLSVPAEVLQKYGAVSEQTALAMADGAREALETDYAVAVTGIAGPDGGTKDKPVGLVYIACSSKKNSVCKAHRFPPDRDRIRHYTAYSALFDLFLFILSEEISFEETFH